MSRNPSKLNFAHGFAMSKMTAFVAGLALFASPAAAANGAAVGIDGSFVTLLGDLSGMLDGNFGALLLLISLIIAVGVYAITSNVRYVVASLMVAFLVGYGVDIISGIGGVTATTDLVSLADLVEVPAAPTASIF